MSQVIEFEYEIEIEIKDADGEVIDTDYVTKTYTVEYDVEPAQRGGREDPSWDAYPYIDGDGVRDADGNEVTDPAIIKAAEAAMERDYESARQSAADDEAESYYDGGGDDPWDGYDTPWNYEG